MKDDRDALIEKISASDGVVLATPNSSFQVSRLMQTFLDRLGFVFRRPRFFGKAFTSIVVQGVYRGPGIVEYLGFVGKSLGFNTVKGSCVATLEPMTAKLRRNAEQAILQETARSHSAWSHASQADDLPGCPGRT